MASEVNTTRDAAAAVSGGAEDRQAARAARKAERVARKQQLMEQRRLQRQQEAAERATAKRREHEALTARAYGHYLDVRAWARQAAAMSGRTLGPLSVAEQEMIAALTPFWDASPEVIGNLRLATGPITGVRPADYDNPSRDLTLGLKYAVGERRRHAGAELFVEESPMLGGFGVEWHRQRYNEDTVRFFKAMIALQDGGVLADCRACDNRRLVWEIGGGWGGFAFQFKTICPNVTYLITGIPELIVVSAVYLMTAFPEARFRFYDPSARATLWTNWEEADFVFGIEGAIADLHAPPVHATLDLMSLRSMTEARVAQHVQRAYELESRYFFSQLPGPCFPEPIPAAWQTIERWYWLHQIPPPLDASAFLVEDFHKAPTIDDYAQVVGWRRIRT